MPKHKKGKKKDAKKVEKLMKNEQPSNEDDEQEEEEETETNEPRDEPEPELEPDDTITMEFVLRVLENEVREALEGDFDPEVWKSAQEAQFFQVQLKYDVSEMAPTREVWEDDADELYQALHDDAVSAFYAALRARKSAPSGTSGSSGSWARNCTRKQARELVAQAREDKINKLKQALFAGGLYTIHHKVSQKNLKALAAAVAKSNLKGEFEQVLGEGEGSSIEKGLLNLAANLEVGPPGDRRVGDPGSGFDPNVEDGDTTPRSKMLSTLNSIIEHEPIDLQAALKIIKDVQGIHEEKYGEQLSPPKIEQWQTAGGGKFKRNNL
jgi:hypothetical protein